MKEITRIHIAKVAYDIEIAAKKQLETYIKSLEVYAQDADVVADIEIRITELLLERGVIAGGVISADDVNALRAQLGEPYEFASEAGDIAVGPHAAPATRRLYRSTDSILLGGVLGGIATYFSVNVAWIRLAFIVLLLMSFGFVTFVYLLLWLILPPARTAAEKLQLAGKEVTAASIKAQTMGDSSDGNSQKTPLLQVVLSAVLGFLSVLAAIGAFIGAFMVLFGNAILGVNEQNLTGYLSAFDPNAMWIAQLVLGLIAFGLLLLSSLFGLIAYCFLARKINKKLIVSGIIIIALGITTAAAAVTVGSIQANNVARQAKEMTVTQKLDLPKEFAAVKSLKLETDQATRNESSRYASFPAIRYVVDRGPARYELQSLATAKVTVRVEGDMGVIRLDVPDSYKNTFVHPILTIYGPAVNAIDNDIRDASYDGSTQETLEVTGKPRTMLTISGTYAQVRVKGAGFVGLSDAAVGGLTVDTTQRLSLSAGTIRELSVIQPEVCPASNLGDTGRSIRINAVTSSTMKLNGVQVSAQTLEERCGSILIGSDTNS